MERRSLTLKTVGEYSEFLAEMESTVTNKTYMDRVYTMLNDMKPGTRIDIDKLVVPANMRRFIGCVCLYIWDTSRIEFDSEYKSIRKL